jgi:hypothetical protein
LLWDIRSGPDCMQRHGLCACEPWGRGQPFDIQSGAARTISSRGSAGSFGNSYACTRSAIRSNPGLAGLHVSAGSTRPCGEGHASVSHAPGATQDRLDAAAAIDYAFQPDPRGRVLWIPAERSTTGPGTESRQSGPGSPAISQQRREAGATAHGSCLASDPAGGPPRSHRSGHHWRSYASYDPVRAEKEKESILVSWQALFSRK